MERCQHNAVMASKDVDLDNVRNLPLESGREGEEKCGDDLH